MSRLKREIKIESLIDFLTINYGDLQYAHNFFNDLSKINDFIIKILDYYYNDIEIKNIKIRNDDNLYTLYNRKYHKYKSNDKYSNIYLENISKISFYSMYPHTIIKLVKNGVLQINIPEFITIYEYILKWYKIITPFNNSHKFILKTVINSFYLLLDKNTYYIKVNDPYLIVEYIDNFYSKLLNKYKDYYLFNTIDNLFINGWNEELNNEINELDIPYDFIDGISMLYQYSNKYILLDSNNNVEYKGITLKNPQYSNVIKLFKNIRRKNKINKICKSV